MNDDQRRQAGTTLEPDEIEITPKMIEAGVLVAREHCLGAPLANLVSSVYMAMALEVERRELLLRIRVP